MMRSAGVLGAHFTNATCAHGVIEITIANLMIFN